MNKYVYFKVKEEDAEKVESVLDTYVEYLYGDSIAILCDEKAEQMLDIGFDENKKTLDDELTRLSLYLQVSLLEKVDKIVDRCKEEWRDSR